MSTLRNTASETFGVGEFRMNVDRKIGEAEATASNSNLVGTDDTAEQRKSDFVGESYRALALRRENEPSNRIWQLALAFLAHFVGDDRGFRNRIIAVK